MKVLLISSNVFPLPLVGYGGMEQLCYHLAEGLASRGHNVSVVCPEGSRFTQESVEAIFTAPREEEEQSYLRYKGRLESGEFEVVLDSSWQRWSSVSNFGKDPQLPIVNWFHSHFSVYQSQPPVRFPMWVGLSSSHASSLSRAWSVPVKWIHNGIDLDFYRSNGKPRGERYLWVARWTPEKSGAEIIELAQKLRIPVDMHGDTEIIGSTQYRDLCFARADGYFARVGPGISRQATVEAYSTHKGFLFWPNWGPGAGEPFGLTVVEAQSCGCVPLVRREGAMSELVQDGRTGFLVDDLEALSVLIKRNAVKEVRPEAMRKWVEKRFSLDRFVENWSSLLTEVVGGLRW